jgi:hypothetical protein
MPEDQPSLHIDTDWKRQAQEEKRRLAEQEKQRAAGAAGAAPPGAAAGAAMGVAAPGTAAAAAAAAAPADPRAARAGRAERGEREMPAASFGSLISSIMTQALFYLGELAPRGGEPVVNLDMAKHHIDTLGVLEEKTRGNLTPEEQKLLDSVLYDTRMRYVNTASQYIT